MKPAGKMFRQAHEFENESIPRDLARTFLFLLGLFLGIVIPQRFDRWIVRLVALVLCPLLVSRLSRHMHEQLATRIDDLDSRDLARRQVRFWIEVNWGRLRSLVRPRWRVDVRIDGIDKVQAALAKGNGVILWQPNFGGSFLVKIALFRAGFPLLHLSNMIHGRRGPIWNLVGLNHLYKRSENWFLKERVEIPAGRSLVYLHTLMDCLRKNQVVSIMGENRGRQNVTAQVLGIRHQFATGSPSLAWKLGSVLLTTYVIREELNQYRVVIEDPIQIEHGLNKQEWVQAAVEEFARRLETAILRHPAGWDGWRSL